MSAKQGLVLGFFFFVIPQWNIVGEKNKITLFALFGGFTPQEKKKIERKKEGGKKKKSCEQKSPFPNKRLAA